jgi:ceramide glucosyltransferase
MRSGVSLAARPAPRRRAVTLLKPLYGAEPRLAANLASFLAQDHDAPADGLRHQHARRCRRPPSKLVARACRYRAEPRAARGANGKVGNLVAMMPLAARRAGPLGQRHGGGA